MDKNSTSTRNQAWTFLYLSTILANLPAKVGWFSNLTATETASRGQLWVRRFTGIVRAWVFVPPLVLLFGLCSSCSMVPRLGQWQTLYLPVIGLVTAFGLAASRNNWRDLMVLLLTVTGIFFVGLAFLVSIWPCAWCWAFWCGWALMFGELALSNRQLSRLAIWGLLTATISIVTLTFSPVVRSEITGIVNNQFPIVARGLVVGATVPKDPVLRADGIKIFAAQCPTCWTRAMAQIIADYRRAGKPVVVLLAVGNPAPVWAGSSRTIKVPVSLFQACNLETRGIPYIMETRAGKVVDGRFASEVRK